MAAEQINQSEWTSGSLIKVPEWIKVFEQIGWLNDSMIKHRHLSPPNGEML